MPTGSGTGFIERLSIGFSIVRPIFYAICFSAFALRPFAHRILMISSNHSGYHYPDISEMSCQGQVERFITSTASR